ncbi:MAG: response regulator [Solirubrobacteraceae bacterium]
MRLNTQSCAGSPSVSQGPSILLVEDEDSIAEPFAKALARGGFRTTVAHNGREAMTLARELQPDVVLLDLALPDIDGRDVGGFNRSSQRWLVEGIVGGR